MAEARLGTGKIGVAIETGGLQRLAKIRALILGLSFYLGVSIELLTHAFAIDRARAVSLAITETLGLSAEGPMSLGRPSTFGGQQG